MRGYINIYLLLLLFNILNILAFGAIFSVAIVNVVDRQAPTNIIIHYAYTGVVGLLLLFSEFHTPRLLAVQARFLFTYGGRGLTLTYFGCIVYTNKLYNIIACIYVVTLGVCYLILTWVPIIPLQNGIRYNWKHCIREGSAYLYKLSRRHRASSVRRYHSHNNSHSYNHNYSQQQQQWKSNGINTNEHYTDPLLNGGGGNSTNSTQPSRSQQILNVGGADTNNIPFITDEDNGSAQPNISTGYSNSTADQSRNINESNRSYVSSAYGLSMNTRRLNTTGDPYLDQIVNSSKFSRELADPDDDTYISIRNSRQLGPSGISASPLISLQNTTTIVHNRGAVLRCPEPSANSAVRLQEGASSTLYTENMHVPHMPRAPQVVPASTSSEQRSVSPMTSGNQRISSPIPYHLFAPSRHELLHESLGDISRVLDADISATDSYTQDSAFQNRQ